MKKLFPQIFEQLRMDSKYYYYYFSLIHVTKNSGPVVESLSSVPWETNRLSHPFLIVLIPSTGWSEEVYFLMITRTTVLVLVWVLVLVNTFDIFPILYCYFLAEKWGLRIQHWEHCFSCHYHLLSQKLACLVRFYYPIVARSCMIKSRWVWLLDPRDIECIEARAIIEPYLHVHSFVFMVHVLTLSSCHILSSRKQYVLDAKKSHYLRLLRKSNHTYTQ